MIHYIVIWNIFWGWKNSNHFSTRWTSEFWNTIYIIKENIYYSSKMTYLNLKIDDRQLGITQACHTKTNAPSRLNHWQICQSFFYCELKIKNWTFQITTNFNSSLFCKAVKPRQRGALGEKTVELLSKSRRALRPTVVEKLSSAGESKACRSPLSTDCVQYWLSSQKFVWRKGLSVTSEISVGVILKIWF